MADEGNMPREIAFDYIKSNLFRVVHCDGVVGSVTPRGDIHMAVWNQRAAIPRRVVHEITKHGIGREIRESREVRDAIVREVDVGIVMDVNLAKKIVEWLREKIEQAEDLAIAEATGE